MHPCLTCGACCAHFRVSFYWREAEAEQAQPELDTPAVPTFLTEDLNAHYRCMKGTNTRQQPTCIALHGTVGKDAFCTIYTNRPSPCRNFEASFENGQRNERCEQARAAHGLPALRPEDWLAPVIPLRPEDDNTRPRRPLRPAA